MGIVKYSKIRKHKILLIKTTVNRRQERRKRRVHHGILHWL